MRSYISQFLSSVQLMGLACMNGIDGAFTFYLEMGIIEHQHYVLRLCAWNIVTVPKRMSSQSCQVALKIALLLTVCQGGCIHFMCIVTPTGGREKCNFQCFVGQQYSIYSILSFMLITCH